MKTNIMVTYYNEKDVISFGNYLLSDERKQNKINSRDEAIRQGGSPLSIEEMLEQVSHADVENWKFNEGLKRSKNFLNTLGVNLDKVKFCVAPNFFFDHESGAMSLESHLKPDQTRSTFRPVQVGRWKNLTTQDLKEKCVSHDWSFFYITDDSRLMTDDMGIIKDLRCAFINNPDDMDFSVLLNKDTGTLSFQEEHHIYIVIPRDLIDAMMDPNDGEPIQSLINEYCDDHNYERYDNEFEMIVEGTLPPKVRVRVKD